MSTEYRAEIDGLRFVAIGLVLLFHADLIVRLAAGGGTLVRPFGIVMVQEGSKSLLERSVLEGNVGVYLFFMISGFVLALPFIGARAPGTGRPVSLRRYYLRRVTRIEPPYVLCLLALFVVVWVAEGRAHGGDLLAGLGYVHQPIFNAPEPLDGVMWSLEVEVQWYLVVPFLALLFSLGSAMQRRSTILLVATLAILAQFLDPSAVVRGKILLVDNLQYFLVGWLIADISVSELRDRATPDRRWDVLALSAWIGLFCALVFAGPSWRISVPVLGGLAIAASMRGPISLTVLRRPWIATIGGMCYSIYLLHFPIFVAATGVVRGAGSAPYAVRLGWAIAVLVPVAIVAGAVYFAFIEKPCMDPEWPGRAVGWMRRLAPTPVVAGSAAETVVVIPESDVIETGRAERSASV